MDNKKLGNAGEDLACRYLERNGYEIIERNKSYPKICEIDIIAKRKEKLVFIEVKTRTTNNFGIPSEAVDKRKISRIKKGAFLFIEEYGKIPFQIDVISITIKPEIKIEHFRNVV